MGKRLLIEGRVQGVGYRAFFVDQARALELAGWIRNRRDGTVEACVYGPDGAIEQIIQSASQGPTAAQVSNVIVEDCPLPAPADASFAILATY